MRKGYHQKRLNEIHLSDRSEEKLLQISRSYINDPKSKYSIATAYLNGDIDEKTLLFVMELLPINGMNPEDIHTLPFSFLYSLKVIEHEPS